MKVVQFVERLIAELAVHEATMAKAVQSCQDNGFGEPDAARRLYREWLNDTLIADGSNRCRQATRTPDSCFLDWLGIRLHEPYRVSVRCHDAARADHGEEVALLFSEVRWKQEVAWAKKMRSSDNDRIAVLAEMWLTAARRDLAKLFGGMLEIYSGEAIVDPFYSRSHFHMMTQEEILGGCADDAHWRPLWLRFAEREFGRQLNVLPRGHMTLLATRCREHEWSDRTLRERTRQANSLRAHRPSLMIAVLQAALDYGLSSNDLLAAEAEFVDAVEKGDINLLDRPGDSAWRVFVERLQSWSGQQEIPSPDMRKSRLEAIEQMSPTWSNTLPGHFLDIGAGSQKALVAWFNDIRSDMRSVPQDPAVDFGMWLLQGPQQS